eukprot:3371877-Pyramimonas_sp.AAC.1
MPFGENTFDGCYCIEAACHAPEILVLYKQVKCQTRNTISSDWSAMRISPRLQRLIGSSREARRTAYNSKLLLDFTGPPVPLTARMHSTPQRPFVCRTRDKNESNCQTRDKNESN